MDRACEPTDERHRRGAAKLAYLQQDIVKEMIDLTESIYWTPLSVADWLRTGGF
jgi:hypothetical protein